MASTKSSPAFDPVIAIDLGTSFVSAALYRDGKLQRIPNCYGDYLTPNYVAFSNEYGRLIGEDATEQETESPNNTFYGIKNLIGKKSAEVSAKNPSFPFCVVAGKDEKFPRLLLQMESDFKTFTLEVLMEGVELLSALLESIKQDAEIYLGCPIQNVVLTFPAYYTYYQRHLICEAAKLAKLNVFDIVSDPEAAALAYAFSTPFEFVFGQYIHVMVVDIGGGGISACVASIKPDRVDIRAIAGADFCGGQEMTKRMLEYFVDTYQKSHDKNIQGDVHFLATLRKACEKAMIKLSTCTNDLIPVGKLNMGLDLVGSINQHKFGLLIDELVRGYVNLIRNCLSDAKMDKADIDNVIVIGGCGRIPKVRKLLIQFFDGLACHTSFDEPLTVQGAALLGGMLKDLPVLRITPFALGIRIPITFESPDSDMSILVKRGTTIPTQQTRTVYMLVQKGKPQSVLVEIYEGNEKLAQKNHFLGEVKLTDISIDSFEKGDKIVELDVTFDISVRNELKVTVAHKQTGKCVLFDVSEELAIYRGKDVETLEMIKRNAKKFREKRNQRERNLAKDHLEATCFEIGMALKDKEYWRGKVSQQVREEILDKCAETTMWIADNELAEKQILERKFEEMKAFCKDKNAAFLVEF